MAWVRGFLIVFLTAWALTASAQTPQKRVALIIANSAYQGERPLVNPARDAQLVRDALTSVGFAVRVEANLTQQQMTAALQRFRREVEGAQVALVYFAGHGVRVGQTNWLLPVDFRADDVRQDEDFELFAVGHRSITQVLAGARVKVAVFDACRNNPYEARLQLAARSAGRTSTASSGLAGVEIGDVLVLFSAAAGQLAADGPAGEGSPFAVAFSKRIVEPGVEIGLIPRRVRADVIAATGGGRTAQAPFFGGSPGPEEVVLAAVAPAAPRADPNAEALRRQNADLQRQLEEARRQQPAPVLARPDVPVGTAPPPQTADAATLWRTTSRPAVRLTLQAGSAVYDAAWSPDGARIVTASEDKTAKVWDARTGALIATLSGHEEAVTSAAFSPDGARNVTGGADKTAKVWDARTGALINSLSGHGDGVSSAAFSPDGARIVTGSLDKTAKVWDARTGALIATLSGHGDGVSSAAFSPDGARIVTGSGDKTAKVWDARTGALIATLSGHGDLVQSAAFSPDGARIVTGSYDKTAKVWNTRTGALIATLSGHGGIVTSAAFSADGARIVTGSEYTAKVWDAAANLPDNRRLIATLSGHGHYVTSAAFSPDGALIVTGSVDGYAKVWAPQ